MDNSLIQTLQILLNLKGEPIAGHELANKLVPIIQVNTLEKNIHYLRREYGDALIPSETVEGKAYVQYWCEPGLATLNNNFEKIGHDTREKLNSILRPCRPSADTKAFKGYANIARKLKEACIECCMFYRYSEIGKVCNICI